MKEISRTTKKYIVRIVYLRIKGFFRFLYTTYIPINADLLPGDIVTTSGIGIYPEGIYIGSIKEIVTTSNITDRYAIVTPGVDFSTLSNVLVIKGMR